MKFSAASILFLAHGIAAMPWSSGKANEDITLRIQVSQSPSHNAQGSAPKGDIHPENFQVCLKVCWPSVPTCPNGWGTANHPCWTCCKAPSDDFQL
ncbi:uncharacterized protein NECHADRAFT_105956 [Fusarium vanettenii 77-13-4]|uniref:Uncharacterized protein n=1 Tax=Fusarium vanettenii (strain ATCC MYA-4622 / CBS 123669 / FGSC 9596 / NRRL 45880 / 77-13-4) TaxID=660122 RepID=C7ZJH3_FUSV7|nr:uncharacterized protein NECHADRAFT_105956 [Fusarium vanettenii 77-13-4]EEU35906.1 hypothetical protein NECHADRAFT_105956 [Fusarium vanettenii 77-13-4]